MLKNNGHGWALFTLEDFVGHPSYIDATPIILLDTFIEYYENEHGVGVFDEEGSTFILVLAEYEANVIHRLDKNILYSMDSDVDDLAKEAYNDIAEHIEDWAKWDIFEDPDSDEWKKEYKENMDLLNDRLRKLKTYIYKTED